MDSPAGPPLPAGCLQGLAGLKGTTAAVDSERQRPRFQRLIAKSPLGWLTCSTCLTHPDLGSFCHSPDTRPRRAGSDLRGPIHPANAKWVCDSAGVAASPGNFLGVPPLHPHPDLWKPTGFCQDPPSSDFLLREGRPSASQSWWALCLGTHTATFS